MDSNYHVPRKSRRRSSRNPRRRKSTRRKSTRRKSTRRKRTPSKKTQRVSPVRVRMLLPSNGRGNFTPLRNLRFDETGKLTYSK